MPLGKYYCDYCDKQFQDTPPSRRRHLQGVAHQRAKALWYEAAARSSSSSSSSSQWGSDKVDDFQSVGKGVCNRYVRTGWCQYGESCRFYHPQKQLQMPSMNTERMEGTSAAANNIHFLNGGATLPVVLFGSGMGTSLGNLPPSLLPPPEGGYPPLPFIDWG